MSAQGRAAALWCALAAVAVVPLVAAANSPLLAWRGPVYIAAGFAGALCLALLLFQPLLAATALPGLKVSSQRALHKVTGGVLLLALGVHVIGLWLTSAPDVIDALLFVSPTPFSAWGVVAMWAICAAAGMALIRRRRVITPRTWQRVHAGLGTVVVLGTVVHALLIDGTMELLTKVGLCAAVLAAQAWALYRVWR